MSLKSVIENFWFRATACMKKTHIFPKMPLNQCHKHTSEDILVILESWMNSDKWHTGLICLSYSLYHKPLMSFRTGVFYQPKAQYDLHYCGPEVRARNSAAHASFTNKPLSRIHMSKSSVWRQLPTKCGRRQSTNSSIDNRCNRRELLKPTVGWITTSL